MDAVVRYAVPLPGSTSEAAETARALAVKLSCRSVVLIGCVREPIVRALQPLKLIGFDDPAVAAEARAAVAQGLWSELGAMEPGADWLGSDVLVLVSATLLLSDTALGQRLGELLAVIPAAVVLDPDGSLGFDDLEALTKAVDESKLALEHCSLARSPKPGSFVRSSPFLVISDRHDARLGYVLAAGARSLATDPIVDLAADLGRPLRVCVASYEVVGPTRNGGIGTANTSLAQALGRAGHEVTLLFTGFAQDGPVDERRWMRHYARENVNFAVLQHGLGSSVHAPHANVRRAYELYAWLRERPDPFDIVHFPECQGHGYYAVTARHQGIAFERTLFVAGVHSPTRWCEEANREMPRSLDALVDDHLERTSVALADVVISPSAYMIDYLEANGWTLPRRRFVQQYVLPLQSRPNPQAPLRHENVPIEEIVFFGRLEVRKGVETFCDALDRLAEIYAERELRISFIGRPEHIVGEPSVEYLARRAKNWPWAYEVIGDLSHDQAMARLRRSACLVVMPSTVDNSPNTVSEALSLRVPFVTSRSGGTGELIDPRDLPRATFPGLQPHTGVAPSPAHLTSPEMSAQALHERIRAALEAPLIPRSAVDYEANEHMHVHWNVGAAVANSSMRHDQNRFAPRPRLSVGVLHRDQGDGLMETLTALAAQKHDLLDVTVVDDGSATDDGLRKLVWAERFCQPLGWRVIRRQQHHAAAAREQMITSGRGDAFVFLRASESLSVGALSVLRSVLSRGGTEILTWPVTDPRSLYGEPAVPDDEHRDTRPAVSVPIAGPPLVGLIYPAFSSGSYAITRAAVERLRGFAADARGADADADLLNRALLANCSVQVIPEPLGEVQHPDPWARVRNALTIELGDYPWDREELMRIARPFSLIAPTPLMQLPGLHATLHAKSAGERTRALEAYSDLDDTRHKQAEYIAYLENEHHALSATIRSLQYGAQAVPGRKLWRLLRRVARRGSR